MTAILWSLVLYCIFAGRAKPATRGRLDRPGRDAAVADMTPERDLLLGVIALQLNLVTREQLGGAVNTWLVDKRQSLGRVMLRQQLLDAEEHELLTGLVEKHLQRHANNPRMSLSAVDSTQFVRERPDFANDEQLSATVEYLISLDRTEPQEHDAPTSVSAMGDATSQGMRFRILKPHARGGLGEVFLAMDEEFNRQVALKQILLRHADRAENQARFIQEAEITGGLEHPGIVPVYGLGQDGNGRPYYAMRFIRGSSLMEAIQQFHGSDQSDPVGHGLQLRRLLGRFLDVCNAVEYAHSRGVIHRDLKPGNIMLGKYGETLVVDWGLAKTIGTVETRSSREESTLHSASSGSAPTLYGSAVGTPAFMSPEQADGRLDELGPRSDVYSLGATLYCLLTGRAPFTNGRLDEVLTKVKQGDFASPREVSSSVSRSLEAICLKAMATDSMDRYGSPSELAQDVENWLADEPVSAAPDPWTVRIARGIRRHPVLTTATAAGVLGATITLGLVFSIQAPRALTQHMEEGHVRLNQLVAKSRLSLVETDLPRLVFSVGRAEETGQVGEKLRAYRNAIATQERIVEERVGVPQLRFDLAEYYSDAGRFAARTAEFATASDLYGKAIALRRRLSEDFPNIASLKNETAALRGDLAWLLATCPQEQIRDGTRAVELAEQARQAGHADDSVYLDTLAASLAREGNFVRAVEIGRQAVAKAQLEERSSIAQRVKLYESQKAFEERASGFPSKTH